jgi:lambda family phage minor tail protein L
MLQFPQLTQRLAPGYSWINLFELDCSPIGGGVYRWTPGPLGGSPVVMGGSVYTSLPVEGEGFEWNGQWPLPTPKLRISNISNIPMALVIANNDLLGAQVTYLQTFSCFLDGQADADSSATTEPAIFRVNRKSHADKNFVELELAAQTDQQGKQIPFRMVLQNTCTQTYRVYNTSTGTFVQGTCPYAGSEYFTPFTVSTTDPTQDQCGRRLRDCLARFGNSTPLPTYAFPGVTISQGGG